MSLRHYGSVEKTEIVRTREVQSRDRTGLPSYRKNYLPSIRSTKPYDGRPVASLEFSVQEGRGPGSGCSPSWTENSSSQSGRGPPGPGCSPSCSAARNSINSAPSSAARSSAMRFLAMCPTTASPS